MNRILFLIIFLYSSMSLGFDTKTHVWVSQQVINDLEDDPGHSLNIPPFGEFNVDSNISSSILNNKSIYRMGNVGPDAFPDILGGQFTTHPGTPGGWRTDEWLKFLKSKAISQDEQALAYGFLGHAAGDTFAHTYVNWYAGDVFDFLDGEFDTEARHAVLEKYIAKHQPPINDYSGNFLGQPSELVAVSSSLPTVFIRDSLIRNNDVLAEYDKADMQHLVLMYKTEREVGRIINDFNPLLELSSPTYIAAELLKVHLELVELLAITPAVIAVRHTKKVCDFWVSVILGPSYCGLYKTVEYFVDEANDEYKKIEDEINRVADDIKKIDDFGVDLISTLRTWEKNMLIATNEYIKASSLEARTILESKAFGVHLKEWVDCYSSAYAGVNVKASSLGCQVNYTWTNGFDEKEAVTETLNELLDNYSDIQQILINPVYYLNRQLQEEYDKVVADVTLLLAEEVINAAGYTDLYEHAQYIAETNVTDATLAEVYQFDGLYASGRKKNLLKIDDIADRVKADMYLDSSGKFNPEKFNVIHNAVILAKLTLLSAGELNRLIELSGIDNFKVYSGFPLFNDVENFNILFNAIGSIDGDFAWMEVAPPFPRQPNFDDESTDEERSFGYSSSNGIDGFKLWAEPEVREKVFKKIFNGPIAPGIEFPSDNGHTELLPNYYSERVCAGNPFPINSSRQKCGPTAAWLIPILSILN